MADIVSESTKEDDCLFLPPGFRFHPTDEEIITNYLYEKIRDRRFSAIAMGDVDLNSCEPWDLPRNAKMGEKVWYFFFQKERKYPTGMRTNRTTAAGYWKATGKDKEIYKRRRVVGMKKTLVFYKGRAPKGEKTNWVMHEFRLEGNSHYYNLPQYSSKDEWVVCRVFHKDGVVKKNPIITDTNDPISINGQNFINPILFDQNQENQYFSLPQFHPPNSYYTDVGQCKVEPVSNSSAVSCSQGTGMGSDRWHGEISSCNGSDPSFDAPFLDLENIWDY